MSVLSILTPVVPVQCVSVPAAAESSPSPVG